MIQCRPTGIIVDNSALDGGDSARANGIMALFDGDVSESMWPTAPFFNMDCMGRRHPTQEPWTNPLNFTRDQMTCLVAGAYANGDSKLVARMYAAHKARGFFCQNIDRDYPIVSRKHPYPHFYTEMETGKRKFSWFDYRDPLWAPDDIWHLAKCARIEAQYFWQSAGETLLQQKINDFGNLPTSAEPNQLICKVKIAGPDYVDYFKKRVPLWQENVKNYWCGWRNQKEIADATIKGL